MNNNRYLNTLIQIAKTEIPQLNYDISNASTLFTQQKCLERLTTVVTYLLHHAILNADASAPTNGQSQGLPPVGTTPAPATAVQGVTASDVAEVVITPEGSHVIPPGGAGAVVTAAPGAPIDATFGKPQEVFLPPGGVPIGAETGTG